MEKKSRFSAGGMCDSGLGKASLSNLFYIVSWNSQGDRETVKLCDHGKNNSNFYFGTKTWSSGDEYSEKQ